MKETTNLFQLIDSCEATNIKLAMQLIKNNPALKIAAEHRYEEVLRLCGKKTLRAIPTIFQNVRSRKIKIGTILNHQKPLLFLWVSEFFPDPESPFNQWHRVKLLHELHLQSSEITRLPNIISKLPHLKRLTLYRNNLKDIPESIGDLENLNYLDLSYNQLKTLPQSIKKLTKLEQLNLKENPILPKDIEEIRNQLPNCKILF